jgi:chitin disaccharide deacetylase
LSDSKAAPRRTPAGALIVNADDWGRDYETTERCAECVLQKTVSSVSAMVFMADSERAAERARELGLDAGLHLNFTTSLSAVNRPAKAMEHLAKVAGYLRRRSLARVLFHPQLSRSFEYLAAVQIEEFIHLYGASPVRVDGHHHMHLCANVLFGGLLPAGTVARRNFFFRPGEKSFLNRMHRKAIDQLLAKRHCIVDFVFSLPPMDRPGRLDAIASLAKDHIVEVETHPINPAEYRFLTGDGALNWSKNVPIAPRFVLAESSPVR